MCEDLAHFLSVQFWSLIVVRTWAWKPEISQLQGPHILCEVMCKACVGLLILECEIYALNT
jgi:hypothetical protein